MSKWHNPLSGTRRRSLGRARVGARGALARAVDQLRARATESASAGLGPGPGGPGEGAREGARGWECTGGCAAALRAGPGSYVPVWASVFSLPPYFLALSPWLANNKKEGFGKGFPKKKKKKVDCKQAVGFRPLPPARLCSTPFSVSLHLQSKLGGKGREGEASRFTPDPVLLCFVFCFFFAVSFLHTCPAAAVIKAPSVISNAPRSPAAAPPRN